MSPDAAVGLGLVAASAGAWGGFLLGYRAALSGPSPAVVASMDELEAVARGVGFLVPDEREDDR